MKILKLAAALALLSSGSLFASTYKCSVGTGMWNEERTKYKFDFTDHFIVDSNGNGGGECIVDDNYKFTCTGLSIDDKPSFWCLLSNNAEGDDQVLYGSGMTAEGNDLMLQIPVPNATQAAKDLIVSCEPQNKKNRQHHATPGQCIRM